MSEEINFLKDKHMLTLVEAEMVLYCEFALDGLIMIYVCLLSFFYNLKSGCHIELQYFSYLHTVNLEMGMCSMYCHSQLKVKLHMMIFTKIF